MNLRSTTACLLLVLASGSVSAIATEAGRNEAAPVKREIIPGSELMTSPERERYRQRIRAARTPQEEEKVRADHVRQMQERARLRGLRLPDPASRK